jgi:hypothetical protein
MNTAIRYLMTMGVIVSFGLADHAILAQSSTSPADSNALSFGKAEPMPELNALFQPHEGWIGGDGAYTVSIGPDRTLWLFSDTWVGSVRNGKRVNATIVNNTLGLHDGRGKDAKVEFIVRKNDAGKPAAFITPADKRGWYWLQDGAMSGDRLLLFLSQIEKTDSKSVFGFRQIGRWLGVVDNPRDPPLKWNVTQRKLPCEVYSHERELTFGASVLRDGEYLYLYGIDDDKRPGARGRYLVLGRAPVAAADDFATWQFYRDGKWDADYRRATRMVSGVATELSISYLPAFRRYVLVYTEGGLSPRILARTAAAPWGPWSATTTLYQCPESGWDKKFFCYAAKAHPSIASGDELIVTYVANSFDFWQVAADARLYWPRFIRVPLHSTTQAKAAQ